ncbi:hypothetical protein PGB90_008800 [Kerria lacca]
MKSCLFILNLAAILSLTFAIPAPNDLKTRFVEDNEIPSKKIVAKSVGVEFGGYRASAGLGGGPGGGGIFAGAEAPAANANAGLFHSSGVPRSGSASASVASSRSASSDNGFFDRIFDIPIGVLQSVNAFIKSRNEIRDEEITDSVVISGVSDSTSENTDIDSSSGSRVAAGGSNGGAGAKVGTNVKSSDESVITTAEHEHKPVKHRIKADFDKIFNIPITALKKVNDFLDG